MESAKASGYCCASAHWPLWEAGGARVLDATSSVADANHDAGIAAIIVHTPRCHWPVRLIGEDDLQHFRHQAARREAAATRDVQGLRRRKQHAVARHRRGMWKHLGRGE